jgi:hypothetical protein
MRRFLAALALSALATGPALARAPVRHTRTDAVDPTLARAVADMPLPSLTRRLAARQAVDGLVERLAFGFGVAREDGDPTLIARGE